MNFYSVAGSAARRFATAAALSAMLAASPATAQSGGDFVFADSDLRALTWRDVAELPCPALEIARNEIFARRGRHFNRQDLTRYFSQFPWYMPFTWNPALNRIEQANIAFIQGIEGQRCR